MFKTLALTVAAGAISALVAVDAGALTLAPAKPVVQSDVTLVAQGCGPGRHREFGRCVRSGPIVVAPPVVAPLVTACGFGHRWSHRWKRCVRI
jgi:hypothetical protein